jgi:hypothetical protein
MLPIENHWLTRDRAWEAEMSERDDPCQGCDGFKTSDCCGASTDPDILICSKCGEHCGTWCDDCEYNK